MCVKPELCGPPIVVGQLQFEFEGIAPLSLDQRLEQWLGQQEEVTIDALVAALFIGDNDSRRRRADRFSELLAMQAPYEGQHLWLVAGGIEVTWLYEEACRDYINGAFFSTLICSHALCERVLAGCLFFYREELAKGWSMWGLGKLIPAATERGILDDSMRNDLVKLNDIRKVSAHFKPEHETMTSVTHRAYAALTNDSDADYANAIHSVISSDALFALRVATIMVRSNLGMGGPW